MTPDQLDQPVTPEQIADAALVLGKIKAHDPGASNPDAAVAVAWAEVFAVYKLDRRDLLAGVRALFADDKRPHERVLAADVVKHARKVRQDRIERETPAEVRAELEAKTPASPKTRALVAPLAKRFGDLERPATRPGGGTRRGAGDPAARAQARAEMAGRAPVDVSPSV